MFLGLLELRQCATSVGFRHVCLCVDSSKVAQRITDCHAKQAFVLLQQKLTFNSILGHLILGFILEVSY
jgi:hypothetical protein